MRERPAGERLGNAAWIVLLANAVAAVVAVVVNWPAQFGGVGTDAGDELLSRGTAISAPLFPVFLFLLVAVLARRRDGWGWLGIGAAYLAAISVAIGGVGEIAAEPTAETPGAVLVTSGVVWVLVALSVAALTTAAVVERLRRRRGSEA